jgi:hypothetical protein
MRELALCVTELSQYFGFTDYESLLSFGPIHLAVYGNPSNFVVCGGHHASLVSCV